MAGELMTFVELRKREEIDICGGTMEARIKGNVYRGTLDGTIYCRDNAPECFSLLNCMIWNEERSRWFKERPRSRCIRLASLIAEQFVGPFETDSGEIVFMINGSYYMTIFPKNVLLPTMPRSERGYGMLQHEILPLTR